MSESTIQIRKFVEEYLAEARLMQVATSRQNAPWVCTVYFAFDEALRLIWISAPERRHSREIDANEHVAGTIVLPHVPGSDVRGIQFEGTARKLIDPREVTQMLAHYANRYGLDEARIRAIAANTDGHMCYVVTPHSYVLFDEVHFPDSPRQVYDMSHL